MSKKKIGISFTTTNFQYYWNWFTENDLQYDVELVELSFVKNNLADIFSCDSFILTGGVDVDPSFYNGNKMYNNKPSSYQTDRDNFEKIIFEYAQTHSLPVLAICRGMQLVNVLQGGKLIQDLDELNNIHRKDGDIDKQHEVVAEKESLLLQITKSTKGNINSAHHQAINKNNLGNNLLINAFAKDGTAEGLEFENKNNKAFLLCVQWHPERIINKEENEFSINIKNRFLEETRKSIMKKLSVINPATEEIITEINTDNEESINKKFFQLKEAQPAWASVSLENRIACIEKFYALLEENKDELANTLTSETGKPLQQSHNELNGARSRIKFFIDNSAKHLAEELITTEGSTKEKIVYEALGIIANISAWNYPYLVGVNVFIPALIGGNAVFYKPSEYSILTGIHIQQLLYKAGVPENVFQIAIGRGDVGDLLLQLPLNGYFFTGSYKTGKYIAERVASKLVPCQLELGGKDPLYVMEDVEDINKTAEAALEGVVYNNGQSCCAVERIYVHEKIYDQFVDAYSMQIKKMKIGSPLDASTEIGPLSRKEQVDFLLSQINDAVEKGATLIAGGKSVGTKGYFIEPTVLTNVNHEMKIMKDESFGPVVGIQKVKDDDEALLLMQDTEYGLTAAVYSKNYERAEKNYEKNKHRNRVLELLRSGIRNASMERKKKFRTWNYVVFPGNTRVRTAESLSYSRVICFKF